jgi:uncharacterized membrane protein
MIRYVVAYLSTLVIFVGIDAVWLTTMSQSLYRQHLGDVLSEHVRVIPAVLFYLVYIVGLLVFSISPALAAAKWTTAALYGALFGCFAYATYDLTNYATIRGWTATITVADICWGTLLSAVAASLGYLLTRYFFPGA